jgi:hypothetical protein
MGRIGVEAVLEKKRGMTVERQAALKMCSGALRRARLVAMSVWPLPSGPRSGAG